MIECKMRGSTLEKRLNSIHRKLVKEEKAVILKLATPILVTKKGLVAKSSTVDYYGLVEGGKFIAFDAKETKVKTRFDLKNIHQHQLDYLKLVEKLGGSAFFLIHFTELEQDKAYLVKPSFIDNYWKTHKSIPIDDFKSQPLIDIDGYYKHI